MQNIPYRTSAQQSEKIQNTKDPISKHTGNPGHNEKTKPKDNWYRREQRVPALRASQYRQQNCRRKLH